MRTLCVVLVLLAACGPPAPPPDPEIVRQHEIAALVARLGDEAAERALVIRGEEAIPQLRTVLRSDPAPVRRGRAARVLGQIRRVTGMDVGLSDYVDVLRGATSAAVVHELLASAHYFDAPDVVTLLLAYIEKMPGVTPAMIASAGALTETDAIAAMKSYVARTKDAPDEPARDLAIRYLGRAARRGRLDAVEFLVNCTGLDNVRVAHAAEAELLLVVGRANVRNWRGWWVEHGQGRRFAWLVQALTLEKQAPFDVASLDAWDWLIGRLDLKEDREPEFALIERHLGIRAGFISLRDLLDPTLTEAGVREGNERALGTVKRWWAERRETLRWNAEEQRFEIDRTVRAVAGRYAEAAAKADGAERVRIIDEGRRHAAVILAVAKILADVWPDEAGCIYADLLARYGAGAVPEFGAECVEAREALERLK